ncbi:MAG: hypothetical protein EBT09_11640 [Actinobacteria bacterium]|nr:hypothetical protein [Actinomycetota bacterium]
MELVQDMFEYTNIIMFLWLGNKRDKILMAKLQVINQEVLYRFHLTDQLLRLEHHLITALMDYIQCKDMFEYINIIMFQNYGLKWDQILTVKLYMINQDIRYRFHLTVQ